VKPHGYDKILHEGKHGVIFELGSNILFESIYKTADDKTITIRFAAKWIPQETYEWFCDVLGRQYIENMESLKNSTIRDKQQEIKRILGL
jgi:hypothetical protein